MRKYRGFVAVRKSNMRHKLLNVAEIKAKNSLLYDADVIFMRPTFLYEITKKKLQLISLFFTADGGGQNKTRFFRRNLSRKL